MVLNVQLFLDTMAYASVLGLLSMSLTLTYIVSRVPNFAHATFAAIGSYMVLIVVWLLGIYKTGPSWGVYYASLPLSFIVVGAVALLQYLIVLRPLAKKGISIDGLMIATLGIDIILVGLLNISADFLEEIFQQSPDKDLRKLVTYPRSGYLSSYEPTIMGVTASSILGPLLLVVSTVGFYLFLTRTKFGTAMRAAIENPQLAETLGINVNLVYSISWFIAGGLAGIAGVIMVMTTKLNPTMGWLLIVSVFAGSIVGGLGSLFWGAVGGLLIGFLEQFGVYYTQIILGALTGETVSLGNYRQVFSLGAIVVMLLVAPQGLASLNWGKILSRLGLRR
ncbi:MAG: branched-chain amino acid ABC transporter permease [Desulfurococcales archaeon]|nr:branched-chain amino acid ABC transporter permease [Desulfurococcales archaeon]